MANHKTSFIKRFSLLFDTASARNPDKSKLFRLP